MENVLRSQASAATIQQALEAAGPETLLLPAGAAGWAAVARKPSTSVWLPRILEMARADMTAPLPPLTDALYCLFYETGDRTTFQRPYFERRLRLGRAGTCALLNPENPLWASSLERYLEVVMAEESWALPAHVASPTGKDPLLIDLFAAEMANMLGEAITLFGHLLGPDLVRRIRQRVRDQITDNLLADPSRFWWTATSNNWNAVCFQGVVGAALALEKDMERTAQIIKLAADRLPLFLSGFTRDGGSTEGPGYWNYGFGRFAFLNEQLERATGGRLSFFEGDNHVRAIASYGRRMCLERGYVVNFSDSPPREILSPYLFQYLGERLSDPANLAQAQMNYALAAEPERQPLRLVLFEAVRFFLFSPVELASAARAPAEDALFTDLQALVAHATDTTGNRWVLAAKGGHNDEHHNHNDCGSYLLTLNGVMMVMEIGSPEYTREFFSAARYQNLAARSLGHSLPLINEFEQAAGPAFAARVLAESLTPTEAIFKVDLTACYPTLAGCRSAIRTLWLDRGAGITTVEDSIRLDPPCRAQTAIITDASVRAAASGLELVKEGQCLKVTLDPLTTALIGVEEHSYRTHDGKEATINRIALGPITPGEQVTLRYALSAGLAL